MKYHLIFLIGLIYLFSNLTNAKCIVKSRRNDHAKYIKDTTLEIKIDDVHDIEDITQEVETDYVIDNEDITEEVETDYSEENEISYRFADVEEAANLILSNQAYYENMNQNDIDYRLQRVNGTVEELKQYATEQVLSFTEEDKKSIDEAIKYIKKISRKRGYTLPSANNIVFVKTTMHEENGSYAYTHGTQIYLGEVVLEFADEDNDFRHIIAHELFHCLTRNNPDFRKDMYELLGFTVMEKDVEFPKETADLIISNPDVEHHNSYATIEINGEKRDCVAVFEFTKPFEEPGDSFFYNNIKGFVPLNDLYTVYRPEDVTNFLGVYGKELEDLENLGIIDDPEEVMAERFGMLMVHGIEDGDIQDKIDAYLKSYQP